MDFVKGYFLAFKGRTGVKDYYKGEGDYNTREEAKIALTLVRAAYEAIGLREDRRNMDVLSMYGDNILISVSIEPIFSQEYLWKDV